MNQLKDELHTRWYLAVIAIVLFWVCAAGTLVQTWFLINGAHYHPSQFLIAPALTAASLLYMRRPKMGHHALIVLTLVALVGWAPTNPPEKVAPHIFFLLVLVLPYLGALRRRRHQRITAR